MATAAITLIQRARRFMGDWPDLDTLTGNALIGAGTLTVADATVYSPNWLIQVGTEGMLVKSGGAGTSLPVRRGMRGSAAAAHNSGDSVLIKPAWLDIDYLDGINAAIDAAFPLVYQAIIDETITLTSSTYEYTVPNMTSPARPIPMLSELQVKRTGDVEFLPYRGWQIIRGATPKIVLKGGPWSWLTGTLRVRGYGPFPELALTDSLHALWPANAEDYLVQYCCAWLLASGEAQRVRQDTGARDDREGANRTGSSMAASSALLSRALLRLKDCALPPMPKHVVPTL